MKRSTTWGFVFGALALGLASPARADDDAEKEKANKPATYEPSALRIYAGPMMVAAPVYGSISTDAGGSLAIDYHPEEDRLFFVGLRVSGFGDAGGVGLLADLDVGLRPRLWAGGDAALSLVIGGGVGVGYAIGAFGGGAPLFHMPARVGPCVDIGRFTFEVVGGPALYVAQGTAGTFEGVAEVGARF